MMETCDRNGNCIDDMPTYAEKEELRKMEKEKQMVAKYKRALCYAARDYTIAVANCGKCRCKGSCGCNPGTVGCGFALEAKWKCDAGIQDNQGADGAPTYAQEQLADVERRRAIDHPAYYKAGGVEAIDVIEAWNLDFCLGNTVKYIARCGRKSENAVEDLKKAAWYLNREIERKEKEGSRNE